MSKLLGSAHIVEEGEILLETHEGVWIRYSHSNVIPIGEEGPATDATTALESICSESYVNIVINPGDILLVNNRTSLHGRGEVGKDTGGQTRWLLRTYGLNLNGLNEYQRHSGSEHMLFP